MEEYFVYILASQANGTLYIGVTNNLAIRLAQHQAGLHDSFTKKYRVHRLVYFEKSSDISEAIAREKQLKRWHRQWKINLIESVNPTWRNLGAAYRMGPETGSG